MKTKYNFFSFLLLFILTGHFSISQSIKTLDEEKVKSVVENWMDSTHFEYDSLKYSNFQPDYTDDFEISKMRLEIIEREILQHKKDSAQVAKLKTQKKKIEKELLDFHPKVKSFEISVKTTVSKDKNTSQKVGYKLTLDDFYKIIKIKEIID